MDEMLAQSTPDIDELLANMSEEERQMARQNRQYLEKVIAQQMGL